MKWLVLLLVLVSLFFATLEGLTTYVGVCLLTEGNPPHFKYACWRRS